MDAVPRWKKLHDKYRRKGLRLVVVSVQDPDGSCVNPGWNPDDVICDDKGLLAERFGAKDKLPAAFLWNWRGELLASHVHVDAVESLVKQHFASNPVVRLGVRDVARGSRVSHTELRNLLKDDLRRRRKIKVAMTAANKKRLGELRAKAGGKQTCTSGQPLTANSILQASVRLLQDRHRLQLSLMSVERGGCQLAGRPCPGTRPAPRPR